MLNNEDLGQISKIVKTEAQAIIRTELKPIKQDIKRIRQDQNSIIKFFDEEYLDLRQRVEKLEQIVGSLNS